ncbi:MAG: hypothetical protein ACLP4R_30295 [Solirubrobacteraceae bacterium]
MSTQPWRSVDSDGRLPLHQELRQHGMGQTSVPLRTTNNSYEPATGCVRHFWLEPAEQELFSGS